MAAIDKESSLLLSGSIAPSTILYSKSMMVKIAISFMLTFSVNFCIAYTTTDDYRLCFVGSSPAFLSFLIGSFCVGMFLTWIENFFMTKQVEADMQQHQFKIEDVSEYASSSFYYFYPMLKIENVFWRGVGLGLHVSVYFGITAVIVLVLACTGTTECAMSKISFSLVDGFFLAFHVIFLTPVVLMSVIYRKFHIDPTGNSV